MMESGYSQSKWHAGAANCGAFVCNPVLLVSVCFKLVMEFSGHVYAAEGAEPYLGLSRDRVRQTTV